MGGGGGHRRGRRVTRQINRLSWAKQSPSRPPGIGVTRARGAKAAGVRYERLLAKAVPKAQAGVWWEFVDSAGHGWCQTDLVLIGRDGALVLEAKYTATDRAWEQLEGLYLPVVSAALGRPCWGVQVCRVLTPEMPGPVV